MTDQTPADGPELVVCRYCGHTVALDTARALWAATYIGGHLTNWICGECWHGGETDQAPEQGSNTACVGGRWVPAIPIKAPIDVRWMCEHQWTPHVYPQGWDAWNYFDCIRCGVNIEAGVQPDNGPWPIRRWIAERVFPYGRKVRRS